MPQLPQKGTLKSSTPENVATMLNAIRDNGGEALKSLPRAEPTIQSLNEIGTIIMHTPSTAKSFMQMIGRIAMVVINNRLYKNPWMMFKKGILEMGESIEEVFVDPAKVFEYDPVAAQNTVFQMSEQKIHTQLHSINYQFYYKATIGVQSLRRAFLGWSGLHSLIAECVNQIYSQANDDEFMVEKYMVAKLMLQGLIHTETIPTVDSQNMGAITSILRGATNLMTFRSNKYNIAGVKTFSPTEDQFVIMNAKFDAEFTTEVLANAFNMDKAEIVGHRVLVDGFGELDTERLNELFGKMDWYEEISQDELDLLNTIPAITVDRNFFQIYDVLNEFNEIYNTDGLWWNYTYHTWRIFSVSAFANANAFIPGTPAVTGLTVSPTAATVYPGQTLQLSANVSTDWFAPQAVSWIMEEGSENASVSPTGLVSVNAGAASGTTLKVTATSMMDSTKTASSTLTVG